MSNMNLDNIKELGELFPGTVAIYRAAGDSLETLYCSKELPKILGMDEKEYSSISGNDAMNIIVAADRPLVVQALRDCVQGKLEQPDIYYRVIHKSLGVDWVHLRAKKLGMLDGRPVFMCSFTNSSVETDIYQDVINHTNSMIYVSDRDTYEIMYANEASRKSVGNDLNVPYGTKCYEYILNQTSPCKDCLMNQIHNEQSVNITRYNEHKHAWERVHGEFVDWCGHRAFVQHIEDVSEQENSRREVESAEKRVEMAVEAAQLNTWEYDIVNKRITYANAGYSKYGLSQVMEHVPESFRPHVANEDWEKVNEMYRRLEAGESPLSFDCGMVDEQGNILGYLRCMYLSEKNPDGKPVRAYGASFDITSQVKDKNRYYSTLQEMLAANPDAQCSYLVNLTKNQYQEGHGTSAYVLKSLQAADVDGVFLNFLKMIPIAEEREKFAKIFNRKSLLEEFEKGNSSFSLEYHRQTETENAMWVRTYLHMLKNPDNNDVEGVVYSIDISKEKQHEQIFQIITQKDYDYVALLHV